VTTPLGEIEFSMILNVANASDPTKFRPLWSALATAFESYPAGPPAALLQPL
jgi:hypothetical protein